MQRVGIGVSAESATVNERPRAGNRRRLLRLLTALAVACWLPTAVPGADLAALPATIERVKPAVVGIGTLLPTRRPPGRFTGTGFAVADGRHVITNAHVVPEDIDTGRREQLVVLVGGEDGETRPARVVATDEVHDLALLAIEGAPLPRLRLGDDTKVREGEVYAFTGFPIGTVLGFRPVTHRAMVSAVTPIAIPQLSSAPLDTNMIRRLREPYEVFQLDATAYPGNSGSPLYDMASGEVVGVINKVFVQTTKERVLKDPSGISYAIPARHARALLQDAGVDSGIR